MSATIPNSPRANNLILFSRAPIQVAVTLRRGTFVTAMRKIARIDWEDARTNVICSAGIRFPIMFTKVLPMLKQRVERKIRIIPALLFVLWPSSFW